MRLSYKFRIYPNKDQTFNLERSLDLCRDLYNGAIQERRDAWDLQRLHVGLYDQTRQIKEIRSINTDYTHLSARVCEGVLRRVDKAFQAFFRRAKAGEKPGYPRFKGKSFFHSITYNQSGFKFINKKLRLLNIGLLKLKLHREIKGTVKEITVKREGSQWFVFIVCDNVPLKPLIPTNESVGLDAGIESFLTLSDGTQIKNNRHYESTAKKLRIAQRRVSRRKKDSNGRRKAVAQLRTIYKKIFNQRHDFQHKISRYLVNNYDLIAVEKLNVECLAKGILAKQVLDASWFSFFQKLKYKAENAGRELVEVNPAYTSQDCSNCGNREKKKLSEREHNCAVCGLVLHRDHNAALNILTAGLAVQALTYPATESVA